MAHDEHEAGAQAGPEWITDTERATRGGKHFGHWWVAERATITDDGVEVGHTFCGYQPGKPDVLMIDSLDAAREFAAQLLAAIDYAEQALKRPPRE